MSTSRSIRSRVRDELATLPFADDTLTSSQLAKGLGVKLSSLSSVLARMVKNREIVRIKGIGPRGGYGYRRWTAEESICQAMQRGMWQAFAKKLDDEFLELMGDLSGSLQGR